MNQQGNSIHPGNIQHFADSAKNAIQLGQRQFFTPPDLAAALCSVFRNNSATIASDLMAGNGALLQAAKRSHSCGIDVDERVSSTNSRHALYQADITRFYPLAKAAGLEHDLLLLNPPFSLQWWTDRLSALSTSDAWGVKESYAAACAKGDTIDSTLATLLIALDSLSESGEGFMICNGDTARRLIGDPENAPADSDERSLLRNIWCWIDIPGAIYEGQHASFPTAVLYFSKSHGRGSPRDRLPLFLHSPSADARTVERTLATAVSARQFAFCGRSIVHDYQAQAWKENFLPVWNAVREEYHQLHHGAPPAYNLLLGPDGKIRAHLDPFRKAAYVHNRDLLIAFRAMAGESPAALVVQQASRAALKHAMTSGAWRVEPALATAVDAACAAYESIRAPFYTPGPVQSLGWLDEESFIPCSATGIPGFRPGQSYPIRTWIEDTAWNDTKTNLQGVKEKLELTGRELVVELLDDSSEPHHFHVRHKDDEVPMGRDEIHHHHINSLLNHFTIPIPRDIAQSNPQAYQANLLRLTQLEALVNAA